MSSLARSAQVLFAVTIVTWINSCALKIGPVRVNNKVSTTGDDTRKQGDIKITNFFISHCDGLVVDVSLVCEFRGSSHAPGGWNNGEHYTHGVLQARANIKTNRYSEIYGLVTLATAR